MCAYCSGQGFVWNICSFDQWGVELGKVLAKQVRMLQCCVSRLTRHPMQVRGQLNASRGPDQKAVAGFNYSTTRLLRSYLKVSGTE